MRTAVFQFLIGPSNGQEYCIKSIGKYCQKYGIEHYISDQRVINGPHIMFEKYQLFSLLNSGIDRVLYLDADIMATPNAENIFDKYNNNDILYAYDENDHPEWMDRDKYIYENLSNVKWPQNIKNKKQYFNAGVLLFSKNLLEQCKNSFRLNDIPEWPDIWYFGEQTIVNYWVAKNGIPFESIDYKFNRMDLGNYDLNNERYKSNFIHYAGPCKYGNGNKQETMKEDYQALYER